MKTPTGRTVIAMSGGVDSSVVAAMLHHAGEDVVGVSMRLYDAGENATRGCCSPDDLYDARHVATTIGIPFYVVNYQEVFRTKVIDYFIDEYRHGRTPSPCILCNNHLKFDALFEHMNALGGATLATGHYARIVEADPGRLALLKGVDPIKDQSYFLFGIKRDLLTKIRFPLGGLNKEEARALAQKLNVPTADKRESQDLCFVSGNYADFVSARLTEAQITPGPFRRRGTGEQLGTHTGIHKFTIGQRRGLGISAPEPLYVTRIDPKTGTVWVGTRDQIGDLCFEIDRCNWLRWDTPPTTFECTVKVRSRHAAQPCHVTVVSDASGAKVKLETQDDAIAPGQAAVFYDGDEVLGGGWITQTLDA